MLCNKKILCFDLIGSEFLQFFEAHIAKLGLGLAFALALVIERTTADINNTCLVSSNRLGDISTFTVIEIPVLLFPVRAF